MILVISCLISGSIISVSAADTAANDSTDGWFSIMDYNPSVGFTYSLTEPYSYTSRHDFSLPSKMRLYRFDMLIFDTNGAPEVRLFNGDGWNLFTCYAINGSFYRLSLEMTGFYRDSVLIEFASSFYHSGSIVSFNVSSVPYSSKAVPGGYKIYFQQGNALGYQEYAGQNLQYTFSSSLESQFQAEFYTNDWRGFDYLHFWVVGSGIDITTIYAEYLSQALPVDFEFFDNISSGGYSHPRFTVLVRVDLTGIDRTDINSTDYPELVISGVSHAADEFAPFFEFHSVVGNFLIEEPDSDYFWFSKISSDIKKIGTLTGTYFDSLFSKLGSWFSGLTNTLNSGFDRVVSAIQNGSTNTTWQNPFSGWFSDLGDGIGKVVTATGGAASDVIDAFGGLVVDFSDSVSNAFNSAMTTLTGNMKEWFSSFRETIFDGFDRVFGVTDEQKAESEQSKNDAADINNQTGSFEQDSVEALKGNWSNVENNLNFTVFLVPLNFVSTYLNSAFNALDVFGIVLMLPLVIGLFCFILSRSSGVINPISREGKSRTMDDVEGLEFERFGE